MTKIDLYNIFTVNTKIIPPEYLYYQKLGQILNEMRTEHGISFMQIYDDIGIMPNELRDYESGGCEIPIYKLLILLGYLERPQLSDS